MLIYHRAADGDIRQTGKLPHAAYKQAESELAEACSLQNKVRIVPERVRVGTPCPVCKTWILYFLSVHSDSLFFLCGSLMLYKDMNTV